MSIRKLQDEGREKIEVTIDHGEPLILGRVAVLGNSKQYGSDDLLLRDNGKAVELVRTYSAAFRGTSPIEEDLSCIQPG